MTTEAAWSAELEMRVLQKGQPKRQVVADVKKECGRWRRAGGSDAAAASEAEAAEEEAREEAEGVNEWRSLLAEAEEGEEEEMAEDGAEEEMPVEEPTLTGTAQRKHSSIGYPPSHSRHWYNDAEIANSHAVDSRPPMPAGLHVRYNYPRPVSLVPSIFTERPGAHTLKECNRVLIQQFSTGGMAYHLISAVPSPLLTRLLRYRDRQSTGTHWFSSARRARVTFGSPPRSS